MPLSSLYSAAAILWMCAAGLHAQVPDTAARPATLAGTADTSSATDTTHTGMSLDAVYNRPFMQDLGLPLAIGGYAEANSLVHSDNGISEGLTFQMRRFTLFVSSQPHTFLRFLAELEFEGGTEEISLEYAALDMEFDPMLVFRAGIVMNPIGTFNQNHDGPKWEFTNRPLSATQMLPATWSNVGGGVHGKYYTSKWVLAYEAYLTNGFDNTIISNEAGRTFLPAAKENEERFLERSTGGPLVTTKFAARLRGVGEVGISYMGGEYISGVMDGLRVDSARRADVVALDLTTTIAASGTSIVGEAAMVFVDVPATYSQQFGRRQFGGFVDVVQPVFHGRLLNFEKAVVNLAVRFDYVDWNVGTFRETAAPIGDEQWGITVAASVRPTGQTVVRLNYGRSAATDLLRNTPVPSAEWTLGVSTYF